MENKEGQGVVFKNTKKQSDKSPDYSGSINIGGKEIKFSGWIKTAKTGTKYISLAVVKDKPTESKPNDDFLNDEVPWK